MRKNELNDKRRRAGGSGKITLGTLGGVLGGFLAFAGVVTVFAVIPYFRQRNLTRHMEATQNQLAQIANGLIQFRSLCGRPPKNLEGFQALFEKPTGIDCTRYPAGGILLDHLKVDAWGHPFIYDNNGDHYTVKSLGPSGDPNRNALKELTISN